MTIRRLESGDFLVRVDCDLRSLGEKRMFVATDADGNPKCPEGVPIIVRFGRAQKLLKGILEGTYYSRTRLRAASRLPSARFPPNFVLRCIFPRGRVDKRKFGAGLEACEDVVSLARAARRFAIASGDLPFELRSTAHVHRRETDLRQAQRPARLVADRQAHRDPLLERTAPVSRNRITNGKCKTENGK